MDKQNIYSEIEMLINELETLVKSLATARELIAESSNNRASNNLSEIEIRLQAIAGKVSKIKSNI